MLRKLTYHQIYSALSALGVIAFLWGLYQSRPMFLALGMFLAILSNLGDYYEHRLTMKRLAEPAPSLDQT